MRIFLTGRPGIGKTTIVKKVIKEINLPVKGFYTEEIRDKAGKRKGFYAVTTEGKRIVLADKKLSSDFMVGRYGVNIKDFEKEIIPVLIEALLCDECIVILDEIGKMELLSDTFLKIVKRIILEKRKILATIPLKNVHPLISWIKRNPEFLVIKVDCYNRKFLIKRILEYINK